MPNLMTHLKKVSEQKPQATYYNVDMLKYQVGCFFGEIKLCQKKKKKGRIIAVKNGVSLVQSVRWGLIVPLSLLCWVVWL